MMLSKVRGWWVFDKTLMVSKIGKVVVFFGVGREDLVAQFRLHLSSFQTKAFSLQT